MPFGPGVCPAGQLPDCGTQALVVGSTVSPGGHIWTGGGGGVCPHIPLGPGVWPGGQFGLCVRVPLGPGS